MSYADDFGERAIQDLQNYYNIETIKRDIERTHMVRQRAGIYINACARRITEIEKIEFRWYITIKKRKDHCSGKVEFGVMAGNVPQVPDGRRNALVPPGAVRRFIGNEKRLEAIEFARQLIEKYHIQDIVIEDLTLTKKEQAIIDAAFLNVKEVPE